MITWHPRHLEGSKQVQQDGAVFEGGIATVASSNTAGHKRTFLPNVSHMWNELPEEIVAIRERDKFKTEVNAFLDALRQRLPIEWRGIAALPMKKHI